MSIKAYKGFDKHFKCRDFQYEVGSTYEHEGEVKVCGAGFHACTNPLDVFYYYGPAFNRFAEVELDGELNHCTDDSKVAAAKITVTAELSLPDYIQNIVKWITEACSKGGSEHATGDSSASSATGYRSASSATGNSSASSATGYRSASSATGDSSASSATGDSSASSATGYRSASLTTGSYSSSEIAPGKYWTNLHAAAIATGYQSRAKAPEGCALFLAERNDDYEIINVWAGIVGVDGIKPNTFYTLKDGKPVEA